MNSEDMSDVFEKLNNIAGQNNVSPDMVNNLFNMVNNSNVSNNANSSSDSSNSNDNFKATVLKLHHAENFDELCLFVFTSQKSSDMINGANEPHL